VTAQGVQWGCRGFFKMSRAPSMRKLFTECDLRYLSRTGHSSYPAATTVVLDPRHSLPQQQQPPTTTLSHTRNQDVLRPSAKFLQPFDGVRSTHISAELLRSSCVTTTTYNYDIITHKEPAVLPSHCHRLDPFPGNQRRGLRVHSTTSPQRSRLDRYRQLTGSGDGERRSLRQF